MHNLLAAASRAGSINTSNQSAGPWRILVVDDDPTVAATLREGLAKLPNCHTITAADGEQALACLKQARFDLLITDYRMPVMDGIALITIVRQVYPDLPVIMITGHGEMLDRATIDRLSIQAVLNKPVKLLKIREVTLAALKKANYKST